MRFRRSVVCFTFLFTLLAVQIPNGLAGQSGFETAGDIAEIALPASAFATTLLLDDTEGRDQFLKSFFLNAGATFALKYAINKPRPEGHGNHSFPSGHTSSAFQAATFIHKRYGLTYGAPAYLVASYVGWSRIEGETDKHDLSDVLAGAGLGIACSWWLTTPYEDISITPVYSANFFGLWMSFPW